MQCHRDASCDQTGMLECGKWDSAVVSKAAAVFSATIAEHLQRKHWESSSPAGVIHEERLRPRGRLWPQTLKVMRISRSSSCSLYCLLEWPWTSAAAWRLWNTPLIARRCICWSEREALRLCDHVTRGKAPWSIRRVCNKVSQIFLISNSVH